MTRLADTLLGQKAFNQYGRAPMVDITKNNVFGYAPDFSSYIPNSAYVRRHIIAILVEAPRGFQDLENPDYWVKTLKNLVELSPKSIEGLNRTLEVEHIENPFGGAGEIQHDISNVTRTRSDPSFTWNEKYGRAVGNFLDGWVLNLIMDPETKLPRVVNGNNRPADLLPDYTGMSVMFIEPDPTGTKVQKAWLSTNMRPNGSVAETTGSRDLTTAMEGVDYSVNFTALTQVGEGVDNFAQELLDTMALTGANPHLRQAFATVIDADVAAADGYTTQIQSIADSAA